MERIIENAVKCLECGDRIVSRSVHDFVTCACGQVSVDGGRDYRKRVFRSDNWFDDSVLED